MQRRLAEGTAAVAGIADPAERLRRFARLHLGMLGRDRNLAIVFQVELRQSVKFMERFSSTLLRDYLGQIRAAIADGQKTGLFRNDINATAAAKMFFGALDEMATNWILSRRRYTLESRRRRGRRSFSRRGTRTMTTPSSIRSAAVLGAGTMGAQIAAHLANAGVPVAAARPHRRGRARRAEEGVGAEARSVLHRRPRRADHDRRLRHDLETARRRRLDHRGGRRAARRQAAAVRARRRDARAAARSSRRTRQRHSDRGAGRRPQRRTSGGTSLGTHFFNPPRYLRLLEIIPTPDTDPAVVERVSRFADHRLGKGVVVAKDTPNFIANHIGLFGVVQMLRALESGDYTIEEIDAITGRRIGRPKSATFRTMDIAGLDVLGHVLRNLAERLPDETTRRASRCRRSSSS